MSNQILLIDDDVDLLDSFDFLLQNKGFSVITANSAKLGIELYLKNRPCIVFLDIKMPEMDGYETFSNLKKLDPKAKVVFVTGHETIEKTIEAKNNGLLDVLNKPVDIKNYLDIIKKHGC